MNPLVNLESFFFLDFLSEWLKPYIVISAHAKQLNAYERMADETLEEFNDEFNIVDHLTEEEQEAERARLKEMENEINQNNNDPNSTFEEALNEWSDLPKEEFLKEKTGMVLPGVATSIILLSFLI